MAPSTGLMTGDGLACVNREYAVKTEDEHRAAWRNAFASSLTELITGAISVPELRKPPGFAEGGCGCLGCQHWEDRHALRRALRARGR